MMFWLVNVYAAFQKLLLCFLVFFFFFSNIVPFYDLNLSGSYFVFLMPLGGKQQGCLFLEGEGEYE